MTREELEKWIAEGHLTWEQLGKCCLSFMSDKDIRTMVSKMFVEVEEEPTKDVWVEWLDANSYGMKKLGGNK